MVFLITDLFWKNLYWIIIITKEKKNGKGKGCWNLTQTGVPQDPTSATLPKRYLHWIQKIKDRPTQCTSIGYRPELQRQSWGQVLSRKKSRVRLQSKEHREQHQIQSSLGYCHQHSRTPRSRQSLFQKKPATKSHGRQGESHALPKQIRVSN